MDKKMGRPTDNPKPFQIVTRVDCETKTILDEYCLQENIARNEGVRRGIRKLKDEIKR
ncbi:MAG: hypothetical protein ACI4T2_01250 [Christensenellales bacterium]